MEMEHDKVIVVDFGGQYTHLISRRIRELKVYCEIIKYEHIMESLSRCSNVKGLIFSGGPSSVYDAKAPIIDERVYSIGLPILGICYGHQMIALQFGGKVVRGEVREYGKTKLVIEDKNILFDGLGKETVVWMSHGDNVLNLPPNFKCLAKTENTPYAAFSHNTKKIYGVQFHPEVVHTIEGKKILKNFLYKVCNCRPTWKTRSYINSSLEEIKKKYSSGKVICAVSGGLDSTVTAFLVKKVVGENLLCVFVDNGLMRKGETETVIKTLNSIGLNPLYVDASKQFIEKLKGVTDPEEKRKVIGETFVKVFDEVAKRYGPFKYLAQGTLYPDVIESARAGGPASIIKTHHNVGGLPSNISYELIEPLKFLYKDEVRMMAKKLGLPEVIVKRHPFPGPGLAARIIGEVSEEKLYICREASAIVEEELRKAGLYNRVWQAFAFVGDDKAVAVLGDTRYYGYIVTVKIVTSKDGMTADWARIPYNLLEKISVRITNEIRNVSSVSYCISSKPPATIEPQ
ncbi:MAG: glutamine-hydrolyzing GMP synthase [Nitrososphaeria archaeon]|nr:glutamine-hydrolyzing GMP synthase [Nitrososphaeria archaeon]